MATDDPAQVFASYIAGLESPDLFDDRIGAELLDRFGTERVLSSFSAALGNLLVIEPFNAKIVQGDYSPADLMDVRAAARRWKQYMAATLALEAEAERGESLMTTNDVVMEVTVRVIADGLARQQGSVGPALTELLAWGYAARALAKILRDEIGDERFERVLATARRMATDAQMDD